MYKSNSQHYKLHLNYHIKRILCYLHINELINLRLLNKFFYNFVCHTNMVILNVLQRSNFCFQDAESYVNSFIDREVLYEHLIYFKHTNLFEIYCRLTPYQFELRRLNVINVYKHFSLFKYRTLNEYEKKLFKTKFSRLRKKKYGDIEWCKKVPIFDKISFMKNMQNLLYYNIWKNFLISTKFLFTGGSLLKCISKQCFLYTHSQTMLDIDLYGYHYSFNAFRNDILKFINIIENHGFQYYEQVSKDKNCIDIYVKFNSETTYVSHLRDKECNEKLMKYEQDWLHFHFIFNQGRCLVFDILHCFDFDCCQIGYDGKNVFSTFANIQALNTNTFIHYSMKFGSYEHERIFKYIAKGFNLIVPKNLKFRKYDNCGKYWKKFVYSSHYIKEEVYQFLRDHTKLYYRIRYLWLQKELFTPYFSNENFDHLKVQIDFKNLIM